jgi:hypothetical protein
VCGGRAERRDGRRFWVGCSRGKGIRGLGERGMWGKGGLKQLGKKGKMSEVSGWKNGKGLGLWSSAQVRAMAVCGVCAGE